MPAADGRPAPSRPGRQAQLERQVAERFRQLPVASGTVAQRSFDELISSLGDAVLVEFIEQAGVLRAVTMADGKAGLTSLGPAGPIAARTAHLAFAVRRLADPATMPLSRSAAAAVVRQIAAEWDDILFGPLRRAAGDRPLVLVPSDTLHGVPWSMLPSCVGRPVSVVPSARPVGGGHRGRLTRRPDRGRLRPGSARSPTPRPPPSRSSIPAPRC